MLWAMHDCFFQISEDVTWRTCYYWFLIWLIYVCHDCEGVLSCAKHSVKSFMKWLVIVGSCVSIMTSFVLPSATQANIQSPAA